ncbi:MAG: cytochrome c oxidase subunit II [Nitrosomonadaceae bacterium]|nr:cytochrome c oxidase subunit II [Nitrosomonadaceae bacterium]|tara:strand:+ start:15306 stop:16109 length:804 start_codon:yes stop_codon:yes gene_type:complete
MGSKVTTILVWVSALFMYPSLAAAEKLSTINLPAPNTAVASEMYDLHMYVMYICVVIFIGVFGTMFYSVVVHRKSKGYKAANFHHSTTVEIIWTAVPIFILIGMGYPATKTVVDMKDTSAPEITIKATGYQWMWGYDYLTGEGEGISFYSRSSTPREQIRNEAPKGEHYILEVDNNVVVPVGKKIRILTTANDVIHAWSVQQLGVKQDAIPGYIRDTWFKAEKPGIYRGVCSELCGKEHAYMPIVVEVMEQEKYTQWVAAQQAAADG